jgi:hypothetical protein
MKPIALHLAGIGILAPGIADRSALEALLDGGTIGADLPRPEPASLSARERRRAPTTVSWSLAAAEAACADAGIAPSQTQAVFASGMGDLELVNSICTALADDAATMSPTQFHNSVHNAPAGYWTIGAKATADATALSAYRDSAGAALIEVAGRAASDARPIVLLSYDIPGPPPITDFWDTRHAFAAALVLTRKASAKSIGLLIEPGVAAQPAPALPASLQALVDDNPAARILKLLALLRAAPGMGVTFQPERGMAVKVTRT